MIRIMPLFICINGRESSSGRRSSKSLFSGTSPWFRGCATSSVLQLWLIVLASRVLAQSPVVIDGGFTETVLNETAQVNVSVVDVEDFGPDAHGYRITSTFLANTGKARLVQLSGWAYYQYDGVKVVGGNATGLIHHSLNRGGGIFWTSSDDSPHYDSTVAHLWDDSGDRPFYKGAMAAVDWFAKQDILFITSLENATEGYCDDYPHTHQTDYWIPLCGAVDDYIAHSGIGSERTIFVGGIHDPIETAISAVRAGGVFEQHTIYAVSPWGQTSFATPVIAAYATNLAAANPAWGAVRLKQELMALATDETLEHAYGGTRVVKVIRPVDAPGGGGELQFAAVVENQIFTVGAAIPALSLPGPSGGLLPYTYALEPALPTGLVFDENMRTISGEPIEVAAATSYTYSALDSRGTIASLTFTVEVADAVSFEDVVADQSYSRTHPIAPLVLPEATGGVPPVVYAMTPTLPAGLSFDPSSRTISGTPTEVTAAPVLYTYTATDANGSADSLQFSIEVYSPVDVERESVPESFVVRGNYPNPFQQSTRLVFDLPWPARVTVEVTDVTGRRVLTLPTKSMAAGWEHSIELRGATLPPGLYLYRLTATSPGRRSTRVGRFVRVR